MRKEHFHQRVGLLAPYVEWENNHYEGSDTALSPCGYSYLRFSHALAVGYNITVGSPLTFYFTKCKSGESIKIF